MDRRGFFSFLGLAPLGVVCGSDAEEDAPYVRASTKFCCPCGSNLFYCGAVGPAVCMWCKQPFEGKRNVTAP